MGTAMPMRKLGIRMAALDLVVLGDLESERRKDVQYIIDKVKGITDMLQDIVWGLVEGVIFCQIKKATSPSGGPVFVVPNFFGGVSRKDKAGGPITWDGENLYRTKRTNPQVATPDQHAANLPRDQFLVFRPGAGSNPEGDPWFGLVMLEIAEALAENRQNSDAYRKRHGKIYHVIEKKLDKGIAANRQSILKSILQRGFKQDADGNTLSARTPSLPGEGPNQFFGMPVGDMFKLLEPSGATWQFLLDDRRESKAEAHQFVLGQLLTSETRDSGAAGSSFVQLSAEDMFLSAPAQSLAQAFNNDVLPWILRNNPDISPLAPGEEEVSFEFRSLGRRPEDIAEIEAEFGEGSAGPEDEINSVTNILPGGPGSGTGAPSGVA